MKYPCPKNKEGCKHGGNKVFNYGFMSGTASYCRKVKKWCSDLAECPLKSTLQSQ